MTDIPAEIKNAIICAHGKLTPNYEYIMELRKMREQTKKHSEEYKKAMEERTRKASTLRRGMKFTTIVLSGHLFDT